MKESLLQENPIQSDWIVMMKPWLNSVKVLKRQQQKPMGSDTVLTVKHFWLASSHNRDHGSMDERLAK